MYYEHREKDFAQAIFYAEEAWAKLWRRRSLHRGDKVKTKLRKHWENVSRRLKEKIEENRKS